jgi:hypothetical protein
MSYAVYRARERSTARQILSVSRHQQFGGKKKVVIGGFYGRWQNQDLPLWVIPSG